MTMTEYAIARCAAQAAERVNGSRHKHRAIGMPQEAAQETTALIDLALALPEIRNDLFAQQSQGVQRLRLALNGLRKQHKEDS